MRNVKLKQAYEDLCIRYCPNQLVTLATNQAWSTGEMTTLIGEFARRIDFHGLGRKCHKMPIAARADGIFFIEKPNSNVHAHGVLRVPYELAGAHEIWSKLCPSGSIDIQQIRSDGFASYCTKEFELRSHSEDQVVFLTDFMSATSRSS